MNVDRLKLFPKTRRMYTLDGHSQTEQHARHRRRSHGGRDTGLLSSGRRLELCRPVGPRRVRCQPV